MAIRLSNLQYLRFSIVLALGLALSAERLPATELENWPREVETERGLVVLFQPQVESLQNNDLKTRAAVSVTLTDESTPVFGAVWVDARIETDRDNRTVSILEAKVPRVRFPDATPEDEKALADLLEAEIPQWDLTISLDRLLPMLELAERRQFEAEQLKDDPPVIRIVDYQAQQARQQTTQQSQPRVNQQRNLQRQQQVRQRGNTRSRQLARPTGQRIRRRN